MSEQDIKQLEVSMENAKKTVEVMDSYRRLMDNKDFKLLIQDTYFLNYASHLVSLRGDTNIPKDVQENILREIDAIGFFRSFLRDIVTTGAQAKQALADDSATLEEILEEGM